MMSFPPPATTDDELLRWQFYIDGQNAIQKELKSINRTLAKLDKRVAILEEHKNSDKDENLITAIEKLSSQISTQRKTLLPSKHSSMWMASIDWMKVSKAITFFVLSIAAFAAGLGFLKYVKFF